MTARRCGRPILHFVTDRSRLPGRSVSELLARIRAAANAGIDVIQIRERDLSDRTLVDLVREVVTLTRPLDARVLVNDRFDIALAAGADGVHLRSDSAGASQVRSAVPAGFVIGRSVHSTAEAHAAALAGGCDYLLFGTVYPSTGKPSGHPVAGEAALAEVCRSVALPVLAIGGIDASRASAVAAAGAAGLAAIGTFMTGDESVVAARVHAMREAFDRGSPLV